MPTRTGRKRPTSQFHVLITPGQHRRIRIVARRLNKSVAELFREQFVARVERVYETSAPAARRDRRPA